MATGKEFKGSWAESCSVNMVNVAALGLWNAQKESIEADLSASVSAVSVEELLLAVVGDGAPSDASGAMSSTRSLCSSSAGSEMGSREMTSGGESIPTVRRELRNPERIPISSGSTEADLSASPRAS